MNKLDELKIIWIGWILVCLLMVCFFSAIYYVGYRSEKRMDKIFEQYEKDIEKNKNTWNK